jgi:hypothetical protein
MAAEIHFNLRVDCESTQRSVNNPALGERALRGLGDILSSAGLKGTFVALPAEAQAHAAVFRDLAAQGHEVGLHLHPAELGVDEFLGVYSAEMQTQIIALAAAQFAEALIPTIGIGAGNGCDGQVLVMQDLLGLDDGFQPKFVKRYANLAKPIREAFAAFAADVRTRSFPDAEHSFWPKKTPVRAAPDPAPDDVSELDELQPEPPRRTGGYGPH